MTSDESNENHNLPCIELAYSRIVQDMVVENINVGVRAKNSATARKDAEHFLKRMIALAKTKNDEHTHEEKTR